MKDPCLTISFLSGGDLPDSHPGSREKLRETLETRLMPNWDDISDEFYTRSIWVQSKIHVQGAYNLAE